jgi:hypothetical protein
MESGDAQEVPVAARRGAVKQPIGVTSEKDNYRSSSRKTHRAGCSIVTNPVGLNPRRSH